jgi:glutamate-1-semialdehyde 2,1-aminomutase
MLYTFPHELDYEVGRKIVQAVPGIDQVRFANSGSEATQAAIRLARAYTGKDKVLKWEGSYNGFLDCHAFSHITAMEAAGTERVPRVLPSSAGIPKALEDTMVIGCFNDLDAVETVIKRSRDELACVLAEPILADAGIIPPVPGFLEGLRRICDENGVLLIFDEIITGFRVSLGGAQELYGVTPDITCLAKAVGGGTPGAAAFGGKKEIMALEADGTVLHGGTYSGNPMTLAGMNATLDILINDRERVYGHLNTIANAMVQGMRGIFAENGVPAYISQVGPMWQVFFGHEEPVTKYRQARASDTRFFGMLQTECQMRGVYFHNFNFERFFASTAHTKSEVDRSLEVIATATRIVRDRLSSLPAGV